MTFPEVLNLNHLIEEYSSSPARGQIEESTDINGPNKDDDGEYLSVYKVKKLL